MEYLVPGELLAELAENPAEPDLAAGGDAAEDLTELLAETAELRTELAVERVARARAEGELAATGVLVVELRARAERAEVALAEARRPWLARVLEGLRRKGS